MYLKLRDEKHTWNNLYLGRSRTFKKGKSEKHWNMVVPIVPRCYTTPDRDPAYADHPRKGWIYIIRKRLDHAGNRVIELWRELQSDGLGNFNDVQLKYQSGHDHRPATSQPGLRIIVPYRINNQVQDLWIAFSEVQMSWVRVDQLIKDPDLRDKRMHRLNLKDCLDNFSNCKPAPAEDSDRSDDPAGTRINDVSGKEALIHRLDLATDKNSKGLPESFKDPIPVVYLDDPVGIARELAARYQLNCALMDAQVKKMNKLSRQGLKVKDKEGNYDPIRWLKSAVVFNTYLNTKVSENYKNVQHIEQDLVELYSKRNTLQSRLVNQRVREFNPRQEEEMRAELRRLDTRIRRQEQARSMVYGTKGTEIDSSAQFAEHIHKLREEINEDQLKIALRVTERTALRREIVESKKNLTDFLAHELDTGEETPLVRALDDHFTLPNYCPHGKVIKEVPNKLPRDQAEEIRQDDAEKPVGQPLESRPERIWPNWRTDAWSTVAGILGWLDKHEYTFDAELETNIDGWALRRKDAGCELLRKLLDPGKKLPLHKRLFPNTEESAPLKPVKYEGDNPAFYVLKQFDDKPEHEKEDRKFATEETTQVMYLFLKGFVEILCMADRKKLAYDKSIERGQATILRIFQDMTGIDLMEKRIDAQQYWSYNRFAKEQYEKDKAGFAELRKFFIMSGKIADKSLDGQIKDTTKKLNAAPVKTPMKGTSDGKIDRVLPDTKDYKVEIENESHGGFGSKEKREAIDAAGGRSGNVPDVADLPVANPGGGTTSITTQAKGEKKLWYNMTVVTSLSDECRDRYIHRVETTKTAQFGAAGLLSIIEVINVKKSIDAFFAETNPNKNFDHLLDIINSSLSLISSFEDVGKAMAKMSPAAPLRTIVRRT
jgi:hypothetical protein